MTLTQRIIVGVAVVCAFVFFTNSRENTPEELTNSDSIAIIDQVSKAFDEAEKEILKAKPVVPDAPAGPHPDPEKCICKGTGKIVQGDGHISICPYHGSKEVAECECGCGKDGCECGKSENAKPVKQQSYSAPQRRGIFGGRLFKR